MRPWRLLDFHNDDLDQAISVWDQSRHPGEDPPVFAISEVVAAARSGQPEVVAVVGDELVGIAVAQAQGERGWISLVGLSSRWRNRGVGSALLGELELRLRTLGVRRICALLPTKATGTAALRNCAYHERTELSYFEKLDPVGVSDAGLLAELGAQPMPRGLWQAMAGMESEKQIIERRIVLPLTEPDAAEQYGVSSPKAVILFGPAPERPASPRPSPGDWAGRSSSCSRPGWPHPTWRWSPRCGRRSPP
jgi:transitional endoplasmic reticulum ATPase